MFFNKKKNIEKIKLVEAEEKRKREEEEEFEDDELEIESPVLDLDIEPEDIDFSKVYAYHSFVSSQSGQVCVSKDEELVLLDDSNDYWWLVKCVRSDEIGYIPADNIETPIERLARVNRRKNLEIIVPDDSQIPKSGKYDDKKVTFSKNISVEMSETDDENDSEEEECKITRVNTGSYKGKKKKNIFSKFLGKKDKKSKKENTQTFTEPYNSYELNDILDISDEEENNDPNVMTNDNKMVMKLGNGPIENQNGQYPSFDRNDRLESNHYDRPEPNHFNGSNGQNNQLSSIERNNQPEYNGSNQPSGQYSSFERNNRLDPNRPNGLNGPNSSMDRNNGQHSPLSPYSSFDRNKGPNSPLSPYSSFDRNKGPGSPLNPYSSFDRNKGPGSPFNPYSSFDRSKGPNSPLSPYSSFDRNNNQNAHPHNLANRNNSPNLHPNGSMDRNEYQNHPNQHRRNPSPTRSSNDEVSSGSHPSFDRSTIDSNDIPEENVIKVYAGNIELKTPYKTIKIEEGMTTRDVLLISMDKFRIPKNTIDEYYIGVIHFESQEKQLRPDANIINVIRSLNSKGLPGITVSSRSSLINANINLLDTRFIKFFLNRKVAEQEKDFKLIRIFIDELDNNNHKIHKTIGVMEHDKVVDVINNALTKFSVYQDRNPYDFTLISLFNNQQIPRNHNDFIYDILSEVAKYKRRSIIDIDFLLKPNTPMKPMINLQSNSEPISLQKQLLINANNGDSNNELKPKDTEFQPPVRKSSNAGKPIFPKRSASKRSERSENLPMNNYPSPKPSPLLDNPLPPPSVPPPPPPTYLPFTDGMKYDSDSSSNPPRQDSNPRNEDNIENIVDPNASYDDPPRFGSLVPLDEEPLNNKIELSEEVNLVNNNNDNDNGDENPPRQTSLEQNDTEEDIKTSIDKNNLFNKKFPSLKHQERPRDSIYSDVQSDSFMSETNDLKNNLFTLNSVAEGPDSPHNSLKEDVVTKTDTVDESNTLSKTNESEMPQGNNNEKTIELNEESNNNNAIESDVLINKPEIKDQLPTPSVTPEILNGKDEPNINSIPEPSTNNDSTVNVVSNSENAKVSNNANENNHPITQSSESNTRNIPPQSTRNANNSLVFSPRVSSAADPRARRLHRQISNSSTVSSRSYLNHRRPDEHGLERSISSVSAGAAAAARAGMSPNIYPLRKSSSVKSAKLVHHPPMDNRPRPGDMNENDRSIIEGGEMPYKVERKPRRRAKAPIDREERNMLDERSMVDDRSIISESIRDDRSIISERSIMSDRGVLRDAEGRLIQNERRMRPRRPSPGPGRDGERRMRPRRPSPGPSERSFINDDDSLMGDRRPPRGPDDLRDRRMPRGPEDIPPHMRDRRPPRGPEDIPPHMRDRRPPRGLEDIPPHMRDRRPPRGPEDIPPNMRDRRPMMREPEEGMPPQMRERRPGPPERNMARNPEDEIPPPMRERRPERTPQMGERRIPRSPEEGLPPHMRGRRPGPPGPERTPQMGERRPRERRDPRDPRLSRSLSPNANRVRNSPRMMIKDDINPNSRDPTGMNMHKPMNSPINMTSSFRSPRSASSSPIASMIIPEGHQSSLNREHGIKLGVNNIERKLSTNSNRSVQEGRNGPNQHRRNGSVSSTVSAHSTTSDRPPKSAFRKSHSSSILEPAPKTPLIVNNVDELKAHSAEIQTVNEFGEIANPIDSPTTKKSNTTTTTPLVDSSQIIDFTQLLNSIDTTLQDKSNNFVVRSNTSTPASTPAGTRKNSSEMEKLRSERKSKFEDMEKMLDTTIQNNKIKSRSNESPVKTIHHESKHFDDSHLKNLLEQLSMTTNKLDQAQESASAPVSESNSNPEVHETSEVPLQNLEENEHAIKDLQEQLDGIAIQSKQVLL